MVHTLARRAFWLHLGKPAMNHSLGKHLHTSASLMKNTKKPVLHESFTIINHRRGGNIAYSHSAPMEFSWTLPSSLDCEFVSSTLPLSLRIRIQISSSSSPPASENDLKLWENFQAEGKNTSPGFNIVIYASLPRFKWSLDGWGEIFRPHRLSGVCSKTNYHLKKKKKKERKKQNKAESCEELF